MELQLNFSSKPEFSIDITKRNIIIWHLNLKLFIKLARLATVCLSILVNFINLVTHRNRACLQPNYQKTAERTQSKHIPHVADSIRILTMWIAVTQMMETTLLHMEVCAKTAFSLKIGLLPTIRETGFNGLHPSNLGLHNILHYNIS